MRKEVVLDVLPDNMWDNYIQAKPKKVSYYATNLIKRLNLESIGALTYEHKGETKDISRFEKKSTWLLSDGNTNAKTAKNFRPTKILYLLPSSQSGVNFCPMATPGCIWSCLATAGRGVFQNVREARLDKSKFYIHYEKLFLEKVREDIIRATRQTKALGKEVAIRLNGTSDIPFLEMMNKYGLLKGIPKNVKFYDYTKFPQNAGIRKVGGYDYVVTYSRGEDFYDKATGKFVNNFQNCMEALYDGKLVAVVFRNKLPKTWFGFKVVDGDSRDDLMIDLAKKAKKNSGIVIGLKAKGRAKKNDKKTGQFVIDCDDFNDCRIR